MPTPSYQEAIAYLERHTNLGVKPGLERMNWLVDALGRPDRCAPAIHVTGTNGKTTTARLISQILQAHGVRIGTYTSPHLQRVNERVAIDCEEIDDEAFARVLGEIIPYLEYMKDQVGEEGTYFEILTTLGLAAFADAPVDVQVLEVGMGGRWDATNVVDAEIAVITNVALDHTDYLGMTVGQIAAEKAGIIKPDSRVILGYLEDSTRELLTSEAANRGASVVYCAGEDFEVIKREIAHGGQVFSMTSPLSRYDDLYLPLHGEHQIENAALAIMVAEALLGQAPNREILQASLGLITVPGRIEVVGRAPLTIIDGAHNPCGASRLRGAIDESFLFDDLILVVGVLKSKDLEGIAASLSRDAKHVIATQSSHGEAFLAEQVGLAFVQQGCDHVEVYGRCARAIDRAIELATTDDLVLITGSLYLIGEGRSQLVRG